MYSFRSARVAALVLLCAMCGYLVSGCHRQQKLDGLANRPDGVLLLGSNPVKFVWISDQEETISISLDGIFEHAVCLDQGLVVAKSTYVWLLPYDTKASPALIGRYDHTAFWLSRARHTTNAVEYGFYKRSLYHYKVVTVDDSGVREAKVKSSANATPPMSMKAVGLVSLDTRSFGRIEVFPLNGDWAVDIVFRKSRNGLLGRCWNRSKGEYFEFGTYFRDNPRAIGGYLSKTKLRAVKEQWDRVSENIQASLDGLP